MRVTASYLIQPEDDRRDQLDWTPEFSRRARGFSVYAAIRELGATGIAAMVESSCARARQFADVLADGGLEILNDVVLNQVLVRVPPDVVARVQEDGTCWLSGTEWDGDHAMRISVSNWRTTPEDVDRSAQAILAAAMVRA
jgi:glutamate/tyrosine decarboxylase-like PLP-dependent enzyme